MTYNLKKNRILITGANGFIAKNLICNLRNEQSVEILQFTRQDSIAKLQAQIKKSDLIIHLAGENRPENQNAFEVNNYQLTQKISSIISELKLKTPILFSSSKQAELQNKYGVSKKKAESCLRDLSFQNGNEVGVLRLPGVFGKWCRPNYNSVIATFCSNIINNKEIIIHDADKILELIYIDDLLAIIRDWLLHRSAGFKYINLKYLHHEKLGDIASLLYQFKAQSKNLSVSNVGSGFERKLYATFLSYHKPDLVNYKLKKHTDRRGDFVEMIKTPKSGQVGYFTCNPGKTRGGHFHNTKVEKFLVLQGKCLFQTKHIVTGEYHETEVIGGEGKIVVTLPGWTHCLKNTGSELLICLVWVSEIFDLENPDTISWEL